MRIVRSLVFPADTSSFSFLFREFRLLVNKSIRVALQENIGSRWQLTSRAYRQLSTEHDVFKQYIPSAFEVAMRIVKVHRRMLREGKSPRTPFMRRMMVKAENQTYKFERTTGQISIPIRAGERIHLALFLSEWHRSFLDDPAWSLGSVTLVPGRVILAVRKEAPREFKPVAALALDTNRNSMDGVYCSALDVIPVRQDLGEIAKIQDTHFRRRRKLDFSKRNDQRVRKKLVHREGSRERHRVRYRIHAETTRLVRTAARLQAAIVLEDLRLWGAGSGSRRLNRRTSSWPRGELHRQIEYKAAGAGVPIIKVDPKFTSKTCPACGARRRGRVGQVFECRCGWRLDRQINAGLNILKTALTPEGDLARAVRFQPGALRHDAVIPLYRLPGYLAAAREESSGIDLTLASGSESQENLHVLHPT